MEEGDDMTEKKPLREQRANHSYSRNLNTQRSYDNNARKVQKNARPEPVLESVKLQRVVTIPQEDPTTAWNSFEQRQKQMRRANSRPYSYVEEKHPIAARTYAQTGVHASSGRIRAIRREQEAQSKPVPARSGRSAVRKGFIWRILSFFAIAIVVVLGINFAFTSSAFRIEQVNVVGTHNSALIGAIQRMGMQGQNIFTVNASGITSRVDASPLVASSSLSKDWPNHLTVTVVERIPVLLWQTKHGTYSVDDSGVVIAPLSDTANANSLMTVVDVRNSGNGQVLNPGVRLNKDDIAFAADVFHSLPSVVGITTFKLRYDATTSGGTYIVVSPDGWLAYLGSTHDTNPLDNRLTELQQIVRMAQQQQMNLATIDLRYGLRPVYTLKNV
jgi:cell division septal protein FtsQ